MSTYAQRRAMRDLTRALESSHNERSRAGSAGTYGGTSFLSLLGLLFIGLKLGGAIGWSWWFVLLPLYGPLSVVLGLFLVGLVLYGLYRSLRRLCSPRWWKGLHA